MSKEIKAKIPELKFNFANSIDNNNYSLTRSGSNRNPNFSRSGGSTSGHTNFKDKRIVIENPSNLPTYNRRYEIDDPNDKLSPKEKIKNLALQLGESCLAADLSALINQKRDMELEKITREKLSKTKSKTRLHQPDKIEYINKLRNSERIESDGEGDDDTGHHGHRKSNNDTKSNQLKNLLNKKPLFKNSDENVAGKLGDNTNKISMMTQNPLDYTKDFKRNFIFSFDNMGYQNHNFANYDKTYKNYIKLREIITNFILSCLKEYTFDELPLLKINTNLIYNYLLLPTVDAIRRKLDRKQMESLEHADIDKEYRIILSDGCLNLNDNRENLFKTFIINNMDKSQTVNEDMIRSVRPSKVT
jgi:hypothetical protein